jgi:DNA-binding transcriptional ArsR family regulator
VGKQGTKAKPSGGPRPRRQLIDQRLAKAISHPLRVEILVEAVKSPISPNEFVNLSGESLSNVAYHFRALAKCDCLTVVRTAQVRGATEHFYAVTKRALLSDEDFSKLPAPIRGGFDASILTTFMQEGQLALEADTMDSQPNKHVTWQSLRLTKDSFDVLMERMKEVYDLAGTLQLASSVALEKDPDEEPLWTTLGMFGFETPPPERDHDIPHDAI